MNIIEILVAIGIVGVGVYFLRQDPIPDWVKNIGTAVAVAFLLVYLLQTAGLMGSLKGSVPSIR